MNSDQSDQEENGIRNIDDYSYDEDDKSANGENNHQWLNQAIQPKTAEQQQQRIGKLSTEESDQFISSAKSRESDDHSTQYAYSVQPPDIENGKLLSVIIVMD